MNYDGMSYGELRKIAKELGIKSTGKMETLRGRIKQALEDLPSASSQSEDSQTENDAPESDLHAIAKANVNECQDSSENEISLKIINSPHASSDEDMEITFKKEKRKKVDLSAVVRRSLYKASRRSMAKKAEDRKISSGRVKKPTSRIPRSAPKPNFRKIHEKNFEKMEPLDEYMTRKAERATGLTPGKPILKKSKNKENQGKIPNFSMGPPKINFGGPVQFSASTSQSTVKMTPKRSENKQMARKLGPGRRHAQPLVDQPDNGFGSAGKRISDDDGFLVGVRRNKRFLLQMKSRGIVLK